MMLDAARMLQAWEHGVTQTAPVRALLMLQAAQPNAEPQQLAALSIGQRDAQLMSARERWFGPQVECLGRCPRCSEAIEVRFELAQIRIDAASAAPSFSIQVAGYERRLRLPNSTDLIEVAGERDADAARQRLLERCVVDDIAAPSVGALGAVGRGDVGASAATAGWPSAAIEQAEQRMAELDPQAEVLLDLSCPSCGHASQVPFEIDSYLWSEFDTWARGLLADVHRIAAAYGWDEADILAMSPQRRRAYLELLN